MNTLEISTVVDTMLLSAQVESASTLELRNHKLCLITDIYKAEQLLDKKKSDFYLLYDYDADILIEYSRILSDEIMRKHRAKRNFGISRHYR